MIYTSKENDGSTIFVFGSNLAGIHGAGAALQAKQEWNARQGDGEGRTGWSYALPTKDKKLHVRPLQEIQKSVETFVQYAANHPDLRFLVTRLGCGLAGYKDADIAWMFAGCRDLPNVVLPEEWSD